MSFDRETATSRTAALIAEEQSERRPAPGGPVELGEGDERMIVLQNWYQRMSPERIARHHGIPAAQVRRILKRRMGGSC